MCDSSKTSGKSRRLKNGTTDPSPPPGGSSSSQIHGPHRAASLGRRSLRYLIAILQQANRRNGR
jgi:hypothetical protein